MSDIIIGQNRIVPGPIRLKFLCVHVVRAKKIYFWPLFETNSLSRNGEVHISWYFLNCRFLGADPE